MLHEPHQFPIGTIIVIRNIGAIYGRHDEMARLLKATKWRDNDSNILENIIGVVRNANYLSSSSSKIYLIDIGTKEILIGEHGIEAAANKNNMFYKIKKDEVFV